MIEPTRDVVLIKADPAETQKASGLFVVEEWKSLPLTGMVVSVGPEVKRVKPGDKVGFNRYASVILPNDERLCKESQILWQDLQS